jgi:hypothetical protein
LPNEAVLNAKPFGRTTVLVVLKLFGSTEIVDQVIEIGTPAIADHDCPEFK